MAWIPTTTVADLEWSVLSMVVRDQPRYLVQKGSVVTIKDLVKSSQESSRAKCRKATTVNDRLSRQNYDGYSGATGQNYHSGCFVAETWFKRAQV